MSDISRTTVGGVDYEDLLRGVKNYACNPVKKLTTETEVEEIKTKLIAQLEQTIKDLESGEFLSDRTIAKVYIGKTYLQRKRKQGGGFQKFDPDDHHTWKKNGISSRWGDHKKKKPSKDGKDGRDGRDGLVVLGAITRETVLNTCRGRVHQEDFALAMEQKLLHHYLLSRSDPKVPVVNETFTTGRTTKRRCIAYVIYMAFSYTEESSSSSMYNNSESGPSHTPPPPTSPRKKGKSSSRPQAACSNQQQSQTGTQQATAPTNSTQTEASFARRPLRRNSQNEPNHMQTDTMQEIRPQNPLSQAPLQTRSSGRRVRFAVTHEDSSESVLQGTGSSLNRRELVQSYIDGISEIDPNGILDEND